MYTDTHQLNSHHENVEVSKNGAVLHRAPSAPQPTKAPADLGEWEGFHSEAVRRVLRADPTAVIGDLCSTLESATLLIHRVANMLDLVPIESPNEIDNLTSFFGVEAYSEILARLAAISELKPEIFARPQSFHRRSWHDEYDDALLSGLRRATPDEANRLAHRRANGLRRRAYALDQSGPEPDDGMFAMFRHPCDPLRRPTILYRWYDSEDILLYVGITNDVEARFASHFKKSSWSEFAVRYTTLEISDRPFAERAEKKAIETEGPLFNHQYNDTIEARQRLVSYLVGKGRLDPLSPCRQPRMIRSTPVARKEQALTVADNLDRQFGHGKYADQPRASPGAIFSPKGYLHLIDSHSPDRDYTEKF